MEILLPEAKKFRKASQKFNFVAVSRCRYLDRISIEPSPRQVAFFYEMEQPSYNCFKGYWELIGKPLANFLQGLQRWGQLNDKVVNRSRRVLAPLR